MGMSFFGSCPPIAQSSGRFKTAHRGLVVGALSKKGISMLPGFCQDYTFGLRKWTGALPFQRAKVLHDVFVWGPFIDIFGLAVMPGEVLLCKEVTLSCRYWLTSY